jgi:rod shape-determining protein MreB
MDQGIVMAGGGSLLQGMPERMAEETHMHVYRAEDPVTCVVLGAGTIVSDLDRYAKVLASTQRGVLPRSRR